MNIIIDNCQEHMPISFDTYGNLYIGSEYQLNITGDNKPYLETGTYNIIDNPMPNKIRPLIPSPHKLKDKVKSELDDEIESQSDDEPDYYPENDEENNSDSQEWEYIDEDNQNKYGESNIPFNFWHNFPDSTDLITTRDNGDIAALYDTYIYNNSLICKSMSGDNSSIYIVKLHNNGDLIFRPIGSMEIKYKIHKNNDTLELIQVF